MLKKRFFIFAVAFGLLSASVYQALAAPEQEANVEFRRVPNGGLQPQIVAREGVWHLVYFKGEAGAGDLFYMRSNDEGRSWSAPLRVNSQAGSTVAKGTIRGAQLAVGPGERIHVAWNGSQSASPKINGGAPMLYARLQADKSAFEPQRNLLQNSFNLDGGGSIAADEKGRVFVAWHAGVAEDGDETARRVFITRSDDAGQTWSTPAPAWNEPTGACACCQLRVMSDGDELLILYRAATAMVNRDTYLLRSQDGGRTFSGEKLHDWRIDACPMSSYALARSKSKIVAAWESEQKVFWSALSDGKAANITPVTAGKNQKHPVLSGNARGEMLLAWTENTGWNRGGSLHWQAFDADGKTLSSGAQDGVPVWSFGATVARANGGFTIFY